ncbi:MAG: HAD-IIA family hydrolase [Patescibacteria group bacterium]|nr:HAD-IIA family hydrolase [Patescibacteria group bacterium]
MKQVKAFAFDLDGTVYYGDRAVAGAVETIRALMQRGYQIFYFTNSSGRTREQVVEKLRRLGVPAELPCTYNSAFALMTYLTESKISPVYFIGTNDVRQALVNSGITVKNSPPVAAVVVALDPALDYSKIAAALAAIRQGAKLVVANTDPSYPVEDGKYLPGCGAMVGAVTGATGRAPDFIVGKPNTYLFELLCRDHHLSPVEVCIVGDSPDSDILVAERLRCPSILFDPHNEFSAYAGTRVQKLSDIIPLLKK